MTPLKGQHAALAAIHPLFFVSIPTGPLLGHLGSLHSEDGVETMKKGAVRLVSEMRKMARSLRDQGCKKGPFTWQDTPILVHLFVLYVLDLAHTFASPK